MGNKRNQEWLLLTTVFLAFVGVSIGVPIFTPLLLNTDSSLLITANHETRSLLLGILISLYPLGQFFGSPIIGRISDNYGRKPAMIYTLLGAGIGYLITAVALLCSNLYVLMISRIITGFFEGNIAVARSAMSDISTPEQKHKNFGKIAAAATTGTTVGPIIGGILSDNKILFLFHSYTPFFCVAILMFALSLIFRLNFTETANIFKKQPIKLISIKQYNILSRLNHLGHNSSLKYFLLIWLIIIFVIDAFVFFLPAFLFAKWHMNSLMISIYVALLNIWYIFGSLILVPYIAKYLTSTKAITLGMLFYGISLVLMLIPQNSYYLIPIFALCDLASAVILVNGFVYISDSAKGTYQGEVMGIALGLRTLGGAFVGLIGGILIAINTSLVIILSIALSIVVIISMYAYNNYFKAKLIGNNGG